VTAASETAVAAPPLSRLKIALRATPASRAIKVAASSTEIGCTRLDAVGVSEGDDFIFKSEAGEVGIGILGLNV